MSLKKYINLSESQAIELLEEIRWPNGVICPHCGSKEATKLKPPAQTNAKRKRRLGVWKCRHKECRKQFTVKIGTIFQNSKIPLNIWIAAFHLMCCSKKGISTLQLKRHLGITYSKTWAMAHKIRYAMSQDPVKTLLSGTVEADETFVGGKPRPRNYGPAPNSKKLSRKKKGAVVAIVERRGRVRAFKAPKVTSKFLRKTFIKNIDKNSVIMTDQLKLYRTATKGYKSHQSVNHSIREYARGDVNSNTAESFFALIKRGAMGTFHHISKKYLQSYCYEFQFRWNTRKIDDGERTMKALEQAV